MQITTKKIIEVGFGFWSSKILLSAVSLGLFTLISKNKKMRGIQISKALGLNCLQRHVYDFLDSLVSLGFLQRQGLFQSAFYMNSEDVDQFLDKNKPTYVGGILEMANNHMYKVWGGLEDSLKTGIPYYQTNPLTQNLFTETYKTPEKLKEFVNGMGGAQLVGFKKFAASFDFSRYETLIDVGGSGAVLSIQVAKKNPHMKCTSLDLQPVQVIAKANIEENGLTDKVSIFVCDFFKQDLPKADVIVMGNILHDWGLEQKKILVKKAFEAVKQGGAFVAIENVIDEQRKQNLFGLEMSINMVLETQSGFDYSFSEFIQWTKEAGFAKTQLIHLSGPKSAAVAYK